MGESDDIVASQYAGARTTVTRAEDDFSNVTADAIDSERGMINNLEAENEELNEVVNQLMESNNTLSQLATQDINSNTTSLASKYNNLEAKYKEAVQTIKRNIDEYYRKQFSNAPLNISLNLTNKTSDSEIPKIKFYKDIPKNSSIMNISKEQIIISCSKFPYDEMLFQYINQYLSVKRISSSFYSELFNLLVKILYYKLI